MAKLFSEDNEVVSLFEIQGFDRSNSNETQQWQPVELTLKSGQRCFVLGHNPAGESLKESCLLCRSPDDEVRRLFNLLWDLLEGRRQKVIFEPAEPSFELILERTSDQGIAVEAWVDAGNASTGFYRWDALGIRFFTTPAKLQRFIDDLKAELLKDN